MYKNGNIQATGKGTAISWDKLSDERFKKNIQTIPSSLEKIAQLRGVYFDWRTDKFSKRNFPEGQHIGLIAQEIETVFPELVSTQKDGYKSVSYSNLVAPLIEAVKELKHQNQALQNELTSLKTQLDELKQLIQK